MLHIPKQFRKNKNYIIEQEKQTFFRVKCIRTKHTWIIEHSAVENGYVIYHKHNVAGNFHVHRVAKSPEQAYEIIERHDRWYSDSNARQMNKYRANKIVIANTAMLC